MRALPAFVAACAFFVGCGCNRDSSELRTVMIVLLVRNKAHTLPHTLAMLDGLDYPKDKIRLWVRSDHNQDVTPKLVRR